MPDMFNSAYAFNQNISGWVVSQVNDFANFRIDSGLTTNFTPSRFR
jgi:hypothetical protein